MLTVSLGAKGRYAHHAEATAGYDLRVVVGGGSRATRCGPLKRGRWIAAAGTLSVMVAMSLGVADRALSYPVQQLPPGRVTLATVKTSQGPVVIILHRIRYLGKVALCMSESIGSGTGQSCANYPLGPKSNQNIGNDPVWWTAYVGVCTPHHFQVISGVVLRAGLTAWLRTPVGLSRMPSTTVPKGFGVAGGLVYALITSNPDTVTLRDANGKTVYAAPVEPLTGVPTVQCGARGSSTVVIGIGASPHTIP
jgi:hypothetical protein